MICCPENTNYLVAWQHTVAIFPNLLPPGIKRLRPSLFLGTRCKPCPQSQASSLSFSRLRLSRPGLHQGPNAAIERRGAEDTGGD